MAEAAQGAFELPDFPLFEIDDVEAAWGCKADRYVGCGRYENGKRIGSRIERLLRDEREAAAALFYRGGRLTDHGFVVKPDLDPTAAHRAIGSLLRSFAPSHEEKMGTVALAIHRWCDRCEPTASAEQSA